jgi:hypothetical protein
MRNTSYEAYETKTYEEEDFLHKIDHIYDSTRKVRKKQKILPHLQKNHSFI